MKPILYHQEASPLSQRIQVLEEAGQVKICLERFDERLGWYAAGSLVLPAEQVLPLQQRLERLHAEAANALFGATDAFFPDAFAE